MNFYGWVRDGVRRAVLLGVSDAVEQLGAPSNDKELSKHLLAVLREHKPSAEMLGGSSVQALEHDGEIDIDAEDASGGGTATATKTKSRRKSTTKSSDEQPLGRRRLGRSLSQLSSEEQQAIPEND